MHLIAQYISKLLYDHNCVIVPGFGGFVTNYQPAKVHPTSFIFNSPSKSVAFNIKLTNNDGLLVDAIARGEGISHLAAERQISQFVAQINAALVDHKPVKLAGIGRLIMDVENNIQFLADNAQNFLMQSYGLYSFTAQPVVREQQTVAPVLEAIVVEKPVKKKKGTDALLPIAAVLLLTMLTMQIFIQSSMNGFNYSEIFGMNKVFTKNNYLLEKYKPVKFTVNPSIIYYRDTQMDTTSVVEDSLGLEPIIEETPSVTATPPPPKVEKPAPVVAASNYFISAGSFYSDAEVQIVLDQLKAKGYNGYIKPWGKYKLAAIDVPANTSVSTFRSAFVAATGISDAWVGEKE